ncbi:MAG: VCBS repeat-containing protein, partial [Deltaproteobacteria bacterium]|nr:VCBS repeat-containing protein [Deltaproteobacteria bacterium]
VFWRMFGRRGTVVGSRASYTWEFGVRRRDAPNDTSWGTIRDFNGDGYDDLAVVAELATTAQTSEALLVPGSERGLQPPRRSGIIMPRLPDRASLGDFNGDGLADVVWQSRTEDTSFEAWIDVIHGTPDGLRQVARLEYHRIGGCPSPAFPSAMDWDGDGYSDIVVSIEMRCDPFRSPVAAFLFIYRGSGHGLPAVPQAVVRTDERFLHPASFVQNPLGDVDLDGYGDAFFVSRFSGSGTTSIRAESFVMYGSPVGSPRYERVTGVSERGIVRPLGDLDGDGHIDWSLWLQGTGELRVYRHSGGYMAPSDTLRDTVTMFPGGQFAADGQNDGGDINGDGLSDVIVSAVDAHDEERLGRPVDQGRVYVYSGMHGGLARAPSILVRPPRAEGGETLSEVFGSRAMSPGDVNGDGIDDMVMGDQVGRSLCFSFGRLGTAATRPDGCVSGWWPSYEKYF